MRSAREFDRHPVLKALLTKHDFPLDLDALVQTFLGGQNFYLPSPLMPRSVADFARQSFRYPPSTDTNIDTALAGLRYLNALLRLAENNGIYAGRDAVQASASMAEDASVEDKMAGVELLSSTPEPGALLLAHPMQQ
ncbi:hypothetical protein WJX75_005980 [Coccomyxa subellipsoidea]|uniref:Uncharacterized protein n=1 Tax=Coccomyxa subellipsoidea TaxID=248742 RepID=A0ABR2YX69_9CHLO